MMRRLLPLLAAALLALQLAGCAAGSSGNDADSAGAPANTEALSTTSPADTQIVSGAKPSPSSSASPAPAATPDRNAALLNAAHEVAGSLRDRDLERLASWIDPGKGLRFSPYPHIDTENGQVWLPDQLPTFKDKTEFLWGAYDGSGEPIKLSLRDYFEKFVYDRDFADVPDVNAGKLLGQGNVQLNAKDVYPDASFVEFYDPGEGDNDWESLILVFTPQGQDWKLCAIVHNQWTI